MNVQKAISKLPSDQQQAIVNILTKMQEEKQLTKTDIEAIGHNLKCVSHKVCAGLFNTSSRMLYKWLEKGCPSNNDKTYNLFDVIKWRENELKEPEEGDSKRAEEILKLQNQNKKLELEIANMQRKTIEREKVEEIFKKAETEIRLFMTDGFKKNALEIWSKIKKVNQLQEFIKIYEDFFKQAMDVFIKSGEDIE